MSDQNQIKLSNEDQKKVDSFKHTSSKIRFLSSKDYTRGQISRILNIRYQWVRNVLETKVQKPIEF